MRQLKQLLKGNIKIHPVSFSLLLAVFFCFCINYPVLSRVFALNGTSMLSLGFVASIPLFLVAVFNIIFTFFINGRMTKPFFSALIIISAIASYATFNYGVIFSREMIVNLAETDYAETASYLNISLLLWMLCFGLLPILALYKLRIDYLPRKKIMLAQAYSAIGSLLVISLIAALYFQDYAVTLRNHSDLKRMVIPTYMASSSYKFVSEKYFNRALPYMRVGEDARQGMVAVNGKKSLTVLVVGETARAANYSLNGHRQDTNRFTRGLGVTFFKNVTSCGTETAVSVPCMFSNLTRANYSLNKAASRDNMLDIMQRAGVQVVWIDNNGGCKGVCRNVESIDIRKAYAENKQYCGGEGCLDGAFLPELDKQIERLKDGNAVIVLHLMGSHGPAYYKRYPAGNAVFKPDCQRSDIQNCSAEALANTYDNTILYTDRILSEVIKTLDRNGDKWNSSLVYLSDHGESLGEKGVYLHGLPYALAPPEQKQIPLMTWFSKGAAQGQRLNAQCLSQHAGQNSYSQDNLFHTMLGLMQVATNAYAADMDILSSCRNRAVAELHGTPDQVHD